MTIRKINVQKKTKQKTKQEKHGFTKCYDGKVLGDIF